MRRSPKQATKRGGPRGSAESPAQPPHSFAEVFDTHVDAVYRFVYRRCRDHTLSEDITQETFMTAIRTADDPSSISIGWLITVARNRLIDVLRRQSQYEDKLRLVGAAASDEHEVELAERLRVERALGELSVERRLVVTLHYIDGLSVPEMAEHMGRSVKSVEGLVTRARRELRGKLDEGAGPDHAGGGHAG